MELEYYVPANVLLEHLPKNLDPDQSYVWENKNRSKKLEGKVYQDLYLDIVVEKAGQFAVIELKYPTKATQMMKTALFGEQNAYRGLKNHGADDIVKYNLWKDVRRIELVKTAFPNVVGGFALMVTNDPIYQAKPKPNTLKKNFGMDEGPHTRDKHWPENATIGITLPGFNLDQNYKISWEPINFVNKSLDFKYTLIKI